MTKAQLGAGNVEIELAGETVTLKPTLNACQTISRQAGGVIGAIQALGRLDFDILVSVIALGLGKKPKDIEEAVFDAGMAELNPKAIEFLTILSTGGRRSDGGEGAKDPQ